jgi:pilus assembly protein CpaF
VQIARQSDGTRRVTAITEITGMERDVITIQDIFTFEKSGIGADGRVRGQFKATGIRPRCAEQLATAGIHLPPEMFQHVKAIG